MILGDLACGCLISYNLTRGLEGYEAFGVICAEKETDDPESKGGRWLGVSQHSFRYRLLHRHWIWNGLTAPCGKPGTSLD